MKQLSGLDELLLAYEQRNQCMHVAALGIYDPSTVPGGHVRFRDIIAHFRARLDVAPVFRRRMISTPFGIDRAYWIDEPEVDLEYHVRHIALPHPGDWRQLCIQVARIHSRPLDRNKPLWEAYVIEGLNRVQGVPQGSFAVYVKFHSAAVDGETGAQMLRALHTMIAAPELFATTNMVMVDREPTALELYARTLLNAANRVPRFGRTMGSVALRVVGAAVDSVRGIQHTSLRRGLLGLLGWPKQAPAVRFRNEVSPHRVIECVGLPMEGLKLIRAKAEGSSTNDILLAVIGGAVQAYLADKGEAPEESLIAGVPLTIGNLVPGADAGSNVGFTHVPLHTDIADPAERLRAIQRDVRRARRATDVISRDVVRHLVDDLPTPAAELLTRHLLIGSMNLVVSDTRGPEVPMYLAGARLAQFCPLSTVVDNMGLSINGFSYNNVLWIGIVSCRKMMPDPDLFVKHIRENFDALVHAFSNQRTTSRREVGAASPLHRMRPHVRAANAVTPAGGIDVASVDATMHIPLTDETVVDDVRLSRPLN